MSFLLSRSKTVRGAVRGYVLALLALVLVPVWLWAEAPAWWSERNVVNPAAIADDYAAANQGQVKNIAKQAYEEMKTKLPDGAGTILDEIWATPVTSTDDYQAINLGQLKNLAKPFYDRLITAGLATEYPWTNNGTTADNYALANIGQVKNLFSFSIPSVPLDPNDTDGDGLLDAWEMAHFGNLSQTAAGNPDGDDFTNLQEFANQTNPDDYYNGVPPEIEVISGRDQNFIPGAYLKKPFVVRVRDTAGAILVGVPVVFSASSDEGLLSSNNTDGSALSPTLTVWTDSQGIAQAWLKCP
jgi:hypothetical protein